VSNPIFNGIATAFEENDFISAFNVYDACDAKAAFTTTLKNTSY
jgi:hypothetical protein